MPPLMGHRHGLFLVAALAVVALGACGRQIGDACILSTDCSPNGDRQCDPASIDGYCTIQGCDYNTCPGEAECVRFFTATFANKPCDYLNPDSGACSTDELCSIKGECAPRSAEVRFCMKKCDSGGDCRDRYECRTADLMKRDGGEPVLGPTQAPSANPGKFCAVDPARISQ
jgi:hypothetical protein